MSEETSPSTAKLSVTVRGVTYLVKLEQIPHTFYPSWQSLANKPALYNITNILLITGSNVSNAVGLRGV